MALWLTSLGSPLLEANNAARQSNIRETQMGGGIMRRQRFSTLKVTNGSVTFVWDATQKAAWETYFSDTLADGSISVSDFPYPLIASSIAQYVFFGAETESVLVPDTMVFNVVIPYRAEGRN